MQAASALRVVRANGFSEKEIQMLCKHSSSLSVGNDLPGRAALVVSEVFGQQMLEEHAV